MIIACICVIDKGFNKFVGIDCSKGRGIIMPGGKWEEGEFFTETASRELKKETGIVAVRQELIFQGPSGNDVYTYAFRPSYEKLGRAGVYDRNLFLKSEFKAYYELMFDALIRLDHLRMTLSYKADINQ